MSPLASLLLIAAINASPERSFHQVMPSAHTGVTLTPAVRTRTIIMPVKSVTDDDLRRDGALAETYWNFRKGSVSAEYETKGVGVMPAPYERRIAADPARAIKRTRPPSREKETELWRVRRGLSIGTVIPWKMRYIKVRPATGDLPLVDTPD